LAHERAGPVPLDRLLGVWGRVPGQPAPGGGGSVVADAGGGGVGLAVGDGDAVGLGVRVGDVGAGRRLVGLLDGCSFGSQATPSPSPPATGSEASRAPE